MNYTVDLISRIRSKPAHFIGIIVMVLALLLPSQSQAAPLLAGALDTTFGNGGKVVTSVDIPSYVEASQVLVLPDGKLLVGASTGLSRYTADGVLDTSFGTGGFLRVWYSGSQAITTLADGKIMVLGTSTDVTISANAYSLRRFTTTGQPDISFGAGGVVELGPAVAGLEYDGMTTQRDGKLVLVGSANFAVLVARFNADGTPDLSFDGDGKVETAFPNGDRAAATRVAVQSDGKIVVGGQLSNYQGAASEKGGAAQGISSAGDNINYLLLRYNAGGTLDSSFDQDGIVVPYLGLSGSSDYLREMKLQSDGKIVIANGSSFKLARYDSAGALDTFFDGGAHMSDYQPLAMDIAPDGRIVVVGFGVATDVVARFTPELTLDPGFGTGGLQQRVLAESAYGPHAVAALPDGKIITAGGFHDDLIVLRYSNTGPLDSSFGNNGFVVTAWPGSVVDPLGVTAQADGKLVVVGGSYCLGIFVRYNPDGSLDTTLDSDGRLLSQGCGSANYGNVYRTPLDGMSMPDGRLIMAFAVYRTNCKPDPCDRYSDLAVRIFSTSGALESEFQVLNQEWAEGALAVQQDGKIVLAGKDGSDSGYLRVVRLLGDGSLDSSFGTAGVVQIDSLPTPTHFHDIAIQPDGKIVVAGELAGDFAVLRLNSDGSRDNSFAGDGIVRTDFAGGQDAVAALALGADGKIVVAGGPGFKLARYNADGSLDGSFDGDGKVFTGLEAATGLVVAPNGKMTVAGYNNGDFALAHYNTDGSLDTTFGGDGIVTTDFSGLDDHAVALAAMPDGRPVAVGVTNDLAQTSYALTRYSILPYGDVEEDNPFFSFIHDLYNRGVIDGSGANTFHPWQDASRADLARWLVKAQGWSFDLRGGPHFSDVPPTHPNYNYIETAYNRGVLSGYAAADCRGGRAACFKPDNGVTRGQMSKMIVNALGWARNTSGAPHFMDVAADNPFFSQIETIYNHGVISGYDIAGWREFRWQNNLTRGQLTKVIVNSLDAR